MKREEALRKITTHDLKSRIKQTADELERLKGELRRRQLIITPTHREISRVMQELHRKKKKAPKATISKLENLLKRLRARLRSEQRNAH